jgi:chromosome segregation ATPase
VGKSDQDEPLVERLSRQGEEALGRLAEELVANPIVNSALAGAFEARERAVQAQEAAMGALGIPSAADVERVTRRLRSVSQRLEGIEDALDRMEERLTDSPATDTEAVQRQLTEIAADVSALRKRLIPEADSVSGAQERLTVGQSEA